LNGVLSSQNRIVIVTGCSGGGKSSLCEALSARGWSILQEAGRQIVREELAANGTGLPWADPVEFVKKAATRHIEKLQNLLSSNVSGPIITDRSLIDLISFLEMNGLKIPSTINDMLDDISYHEEVLYVPPWRQIFNIDDERSKSFAEAATEHEATQDAYVRSGFRMTEIPRGSIAYRVDFVEAFGPLRTRK